MVMENGLESYKLGSIFGTKNGYSHPCHLTYPNWNLPENGDRNLPEFAENWQEYANLAGN